MLLCECKYGSFSCTHKSSRHLHRQGLLLRVTIDIVFVLHDFDGDDDDDARQKGFIDRFDGIASRYKQQLLFDHRCERVAQKDDLLGEM